MSRRKRTAEAPAIDRGDVVVISGGARGITAEVAVALAESFGPRLVLLGRTPAPAVEPDWLAPLAGDVEIRRAIRDRIGKNGTPQTINEQLRTIFGQREIRRTLERIKSTGSQVSYHAVDVRDRAAIASLVHGITDQSGPIRGLIHAAGVLADRRIEDQTASQFAQVFDTKVEGLHSLVEAVDQSALRFLVVFSSSTARFGRTGQVAYAAANEFLNKWAQRAAMEHTGCRTVAFNWGPWNGGMVSDSLKPIFEREGLGLIPLAEARPSPGGGDRSTGTAAHGNCRPGPLPARLCRRMKQLLRPTIIPGQTASWSRCLSGRSTWARCR